MDRNQTGITRESAPAQDVNQLGSRQFAVPKHGCETLRS
jgi:hypothetical protein